MLGSRRRIVGDRDTRTEKDQAPMTEQPYGTYADATGQEARPVAGPSVQAPDQVKSQPVMMSNLDELVQDINSTDLNKVMTWPLEPRPNWSLQFNTYISSVEFKEFQRRASNQGNRKARRSGAGQTDQFALAVTIIQEKSHAILHNDAVVGDDDGDPMTLRSKEFVKFIQETKIGTDVNTAADAIEVFLTPGFMLKLGESIAAEAGYAGEVEPVDP